MMKEQNLNQEVISKRVSDRFGSEKKQAKHRALNTSIGLFVSLMLTVSMAWGYNKFEELDAAQIVTSELAQIVEDEGYKRCVYKDSREFYTIGFGHLVLVTESFEKCITAEQAVTMLRADYHYASESVDTRYLWAYGEVRLVLINMTYQMGSTGVSKFKNTLAHLQGEEYDKAAIELLDSSWARQTPNRASRLAGRIMGLN